MTFSAGDGMDRLPVPAPPFGLLPAFMPPAALPFLPEDPVLSFFAYTNKSADLANDISRRLSSSFRIDLGKEHVVGGICFGGYPYLPYSNRYLQKTGMNSANFGLPREVRLLCLGETGDRKSNGAAFEFLDSEYSTTKQDVVSHSGFHFLATDPVKTRLIEVRFSDYPLILRHVDMTEHSPDLFYGFIIPYFYVYEYEERTRFRPQVSGGLLGVKRPLHPRILSPGGLSTVERGDFQPPTTGADASDMPPGDLLRQFSSLLNSDHCYSPGNTDTEGWYYDYTAASVFGQQRQYKERLHAKECFISTPIKQDDKLILYIEQGEDHARCIAGLTMLMPFIPEAEFSQDVMEGVVDTFHELFGNDDPNDQVSAREELEAFLRGFLRIPPDINFCEKIGVRVFEIDPPEGVSPVSVNPDEKYATLLAEQEIDTSSEILHATFLNGIKFTRPSNAKYFAIELTNRDNESSQFVIKALRLMQSAHVSIHPRAARTQQVKTLNFRVIGADLAGDYAKLGEEGFNFSIERLIAGERKSVLFKANSLLDLLHTGAAKIFSNVRRRAVEFEKSEIYPAFEDDAVKYFVPGEFTLDGGYRFTPNYERRKSESRVDGWRRSETGDGIDQEVADKYDWTDKKNAPGTFENYSSQQIRTHSNILFPDASLPEWGSAALFANGLTVVYNGGQLLDAALTGNSSDLLLRTYRADDNNGVHQLVRNFSRYWRGIDTDRLKVTGTLGITQSPCGLTVTSAEMLQDLLDIFKDFNDPTKFGDLLIAVFGLSAVFMPNSPAQLGVLLPTLNGLNLGLSLTAAGFGLSANPAPGTFLPSVSQNAASGTQGTIARQAMHTGYSKSQFLNAGYDEAETETTITAGETKRIITRREVPARGDNRYDTQRVRGAEVMWQGEIVDIITGAITLNFTLPATATKMHVRTVDDSLRVRFGSGVGKSVSVDFWFDITEEVVRDDY
ncbi:hypothetical protein [Nitrospira sp. BLG_1]|uniref:hypothetical protein n=1 Tax=Nitrospira sp. BLG_1 TaxID=3395883 RepID=UPI0039BCCF32